MVIVDTALKRCQEEGTLIRVGLVGAGYMARAIALQIEQSVPGMRVAAIANRHIERARDAYRLAESPSDPVTAADVAAVEDAVAWNRPVVVEDAQLVCRADGIDVVVDCTGDIEFGAGVALAAIGHAKHLVLLKGKLKALQEIEDVLRRKILAIFSKRALAIDLVKVAHLEFHTVGPHCNGTVNHLHGPF